MRHIVLGTVLVALALLHAVTHDEWREERERLERENAELRELVAELASFISRSDWLQWPELADRMAKLRVEVE